MATAIECMVVNPFQLANILCDKLLLCLMGCAFRCHTQGFQQGGGGLAQAGFRAGCDRRCTVICATMTLLFFVTVSGADAPCFLFSCMPLPLCKDKGKK